MPATHNPNPTTTTPRTLYLALELGRSDDYA
jgi:hypothetical protein